MDEATIRCPKCKAVIKLTDAVAAPLLESARAQFDKDLAAERTKITAEEMSKAIAGAAKASDEAIKASQASANRAIADAVSLRETLKAHEVKLAEAQKEQARLLTKERELDDARREMELNIAKQVNAASETIRLQSQQAAEASLSLKVTEKEEQIAAMARQIDDLKRRAEQGSQQVQGEAQEVVLEQMLRARFPLDEIMPVAKGVFGGDVVQKVVGASGQPAGTILWESKRTKSWSGGWLVKLREDQRAAKADLALLVTQVMPKDDSGKLLEGFDLVDGVWVAEWRMAIPVAVALRQSLIEVEMVRAAGVGQKSKMETMYAYLTGSQFKHRVQAIVEKFSMMAEDLAKERTAMTRMWAKREGMIQGALEAAAGMYGDLQGIAGRSMPEVEGLGLGVGVKELE